jgi:bifunctional non-homologous end joining protein LigD
MKAHGSNSRRQKMPAFVEPCLATLTTSAPRGDRWVHEIKFDGYRLQARIKNGEVQLLTRNGLDWTQRFSVLAKVLASLKTKSAIIDGEAVAENDSGASDFGMLVNALKRGNSERIVYFAFDLLHLNGMDTTSLGLDKRKELLQTVLRPLPPAGLVRFSKHMAGDGKAMLAEACKLGIEGIVSKQISAPYRSGRRGDWLKAKCVRTDEFVVVGYLESSALKNAIGALVLSYYDANKFIYAGRVGTGFSHATARKLWNTLQRHRTNASALSTKLDGSQERDVQWVKPELVAQIEYRTWTGDGLLRHASFKGLREDKKPRQVSRPDF